MVAYAPVHCHDSRNPFNRVAPMKLPATIALTLGLTLGSGTFAQQEPDMIDTMRAMQYFLHKLSLSVDANNGNLADFYAHELEETIEDAQEIEAYHDQAIGKLTSAMLVPAFETLEKSLESGEHERARKRLEDLVDACNACHQATGYDYINIVVREENPYLQSFHPKE